MNGTVAEMDMFLFFFNNSFPNFPQALYSYTGFSILNHYLKLVYEHRKLLENILDV